MSESRPCCRDLVSHPGGASPFDRVIALGYYDGPEEGMVRCGGCGREFRFALLGSRWESPDTEGEREIRAFALSPISEGSLAIFNAAMARYQEPIRPNWVPLWSFPSDEERVEMDRMVDQILRQAGPAELAIASSTWPSEEILAARPFAAIGPIDGRDWFETLGLIKAEVKS